LLYSAPAKVFLTGSSESTITARPTPNAAPTRLNVRKSIDSLSAQEGIQYRVKIRPTDRNVPLSGEIPQRPGPAYRQEWANAMKATNYSDFSQRIWTCGVNAPPPGAAGASASSPGAR